MRISRLVCAVLIVIFGTQAFASRGVLMPDGVSYLDLARAAQSGDWSRFVNGYWSPVYPLAISVVALLVPGRFDLLLALHVMNATALAAAVLVIARNVRAVRPPELRWLAPLCAGGLMVSIDVIGATTPDAILTLLAALVAVDLARHPEPRLRRGAAYALMYLTKAGTLPWLLLMGAVELWLARKNGAVRPALRMLAPVAVAIVAWLGAVSLAAGHPTIGSTGSLNWEWYGWGIRSRFPDTDPAGHRTYSYPRLAATWTPGGADSLRLADFGRTTATYLPWSDPAGWSYGRTPPANGIDRSVMRAVERGAVNLWLNGVEVVKWSLAALALLACWWPHRSSRKRKRGLGTPDVVVAGSGLAGLAIVCVVVVVARLALPWLVLVVVGVLLRCELPNAGKGPRREWRWPGWLRALAVAGLVIASAASGVSAFRQDRLESTGSAQREAARGADGPDATAIDSSVVLVGSATALMPDLWLHGRHVVAQLVDSAFAVRREGERAAILDYLAYRYHGQAGSMWVVSRRSAGVERRDVRPDITTYVDQVSVVTINR